MQVGTYLCLRQACLDDELWRVVNYLKAEYLSPKKVKLLSYYRFI